MTPIIKLKNKINLNGSTLNANMIYYNNDLRGQEKILTASRKPVQDCSNVDDEILINISNVAASFNLKSHLNLRYLALNGHNVEYRREKAVI